MIKKIPVGEGALGLYQWKDALYVLGYNQIRIVENTADTLVAGVVFDINLKTGVLSSVLLIQMHH